MKDVQPVLALFANPIVDTIINLLEAGIIAYLWYRIESIQAGVDYITNFIDEENQEDA